MFIESLNNLRMTDHYLLSTREGTGVLASAFTCMTWIPLSSISGRHEHLQKTLVESVRKRIKAGEFDEGRIKQYELQLEHFMSQEPGFEFLLSHGFFSFPSEISHL